VLIKTKTLSFVLKQKTNKNHLPSDGSEDNMGTMSVSRRALCLNLEVANGDI